MTDLTSACTFRTGVVGDLRIVNIQTPNNAIVADTINLNSANANQSNSAVVISDIYDVIMCSSANNKNAADLVYTCSWVRSTGVVTLGASIAGTYFITVIGK